MSDEWINTVNEHTCSFSESLYSLGNDFFQYSVIDKTFHLCCEVWRSKLIGAGIPNIPCSRDFGKKMGSYLINPTYQGVSKHKFMGKNQNKNIMTTFKYTRPNISNKEMITELLKLGITSSQHHESKHSQAFDGPNIDMPTTQVQVSVIFIIII
jgi:hypothetical protein